MERREYNEGSFNDGRMSRLDGYSLQHCPSKEIVGLYAKESWIAGWWDADAGIVADNIIIPVWR